MAGQVDPERAAAIAAKLPADFMADVAVHIDPRQVTELVVALPASTIAAVGRSLAQRGEWLVMADFVAALPATSLQATIDSLDDEALLRTAALLQDPARVGEVVALLDAERIRAVRATAARDGLQAHLDHIVARCDDAQRARLDG